jgi:hypothetical protein
VADCIVAQSEFLIKTMLASNELTAVRLIDVRTLCIALALAHLAAFVARSCHL